MITQKDIRYVATSSYSQGEKVVTLELVERLREQLKKELRCYSQLPTPTNISKIIDSVFGVEAKK